MASEQEAIGNDLVMSRSGLLRRVVKESQFYGCMFRLYESEVFRVYASQRQGGEVCPLLEHGWGCRRPGP